MMTLTIQLDSRAAVARRLDPDADIVTITVPGCVLVLPIQMHTIEVAANLGANLLAAARRQHQEDSKA